ncbi:MAG: serine hydrolase [Candidatus Hermodarchaeota archaeon]
MLKIYFKRILFLSILLLGFIIIPFPQIDTGKNGKHTQTLNNDVLFEPNPSTQYSTNFANLTGHAWEIRKVKFSTDGKSLASGSHDGSIKIWDISNGEVLDTLQGHYYGAISLAFSPDGSKLASGGWGKKINIWDLTSGSLIQSWSISPYIAMDLAFSPDGESLIVGKGVWGGNFAQPQENTLNLFNISNGGIIQNFTGHTNAVSSVLFSQDGTWIVSGSWDNSIKIWNVTSGSEIHSLNNHTFIVSSISLSPDESMLASGSFDKSINLWNISSGQLLEKFSTSNQEVWSVAFSNNNSILAAAVGDLDYWPNPSTFWEAFGDMQNSSIQLWDIPNKKIIETLQGHYHIIESIDFSPDGSILASGSWDWTIKLWGDFASISNNRQIDYWPTSIPEAQWMDSSLLDEISEDWSHLIHGLVVIRHGKLVFERYYNDGNHIYTRDSKHVLFSATKSFTSALIGIAINKGFINSINQRILDFFPEYNFSNVDSRKRNLTIRHLLTMTSGITWHEEASNDDLRRMYFSPDSVQYVLDKVMLAEPGTLYQYISGASHLLSAIIKKTTGKSAREFGLENLFRPMGIENNDVVWMADTNGDSYGGIGLFLTPRNMAKLGQLYLDKGLWKGRPVNPVRIILPQWITSSSKNQIEGIPINGFGPLGFLTGYGFQWWISGELNGFSAEGYQGQVIFVHPTLDLVIAFNARASLTPYGVIEDILQAVNIIPETIISWITVLMLPSLILILFLFRKKINRVKD